MVTRSPATMKMMLMPLDRFVSLDGPHLQRPTARLLIKLCCFFVGLTGLPPPVKMQVQACLRRTGLFRGKANRNEILIKRTACSKKT